ncbi:MAG: aldehyde dehydrogenase family protein [Actinomycetaceae bacterium]|nr:aldehyde dehydrogenase family protein [Actinomycetaceae bacterium]
MKPQTVSETRFLSNFIDGQWVKGDGDATESLNPADGSVVARFTAATSEQLSTMIDVSVKAQNAWDNVGIIQRGLILRQAAQIMSERAEELAELMTAEQGKVLGDSRAEVGATIETLYYHAGCARSANGSTYPSSVPDELIRTIRRPLGTVGVVTPWNFPLQIAAWKIAPALLWGNTVVWKPSSETPAIAVEFVKILAQAGVIPGAINLLLGSGRLGGTMVADPRVAGVTFTGSVRVGHIIRDAVIPRGAKLQMELGGHNPTIVLPDADMELAADSIVAASMGSTGQKCTATRRIITVGEAYDALAPQIAKRVEALSVGQGDADDSQIGPVISRKARVEIDDAIALAVSEGAQVLAKAGIPDEDGAYATPTLLTGSRDLTICREEVFGPVTTILKVDSLQDAVELANDTEYGLTASLFTSDERSVRYFLTHVEAGLVKVNAPSTGSEVHGPFGGLKNSTYPGPREQNGDSSADFFTQTKTAYIRLAPEKDSR